jgi:putative glutamine amidotransferase
VRVNEAYVDALVGAGITPFILPPIAPRAAIAALDGVDALLLTGGEDIDPKHFDQPPHAKTGEPHAARDACELALARGAHERRTPTLAICRGTQLINVALGGTLVQDIGSRRATDINHDQPARRTERVHAVAVDEGSLLSRIVGAADITVNSSHHQSVDEVADGFRVTARASDGIIEAVESTDPGWWMLGVQWHPEELVDTPEDWDRRLFEALALAARAELAANGR